MTTESEDSARDVLIAKIISGSGLFLFSVLFGIIPFKLAKMFNWVEPLGTGESNKAERKGSSTVNMLLCFGGGVLLATTFLHLLPDINATVEFLIDEELMPDLGISYGELFMMIGFFLIYLIEEIVHNFLHRYQAKKASEKEEQKDADCIDDAFQRGVLARNSAIIKRLSHAQIEVSDSLETAEKHPEHNNHGHGHSHLPVPHSDDEDMLVSSLRGLLIVLALSIHELFEGFAVGLNSSAAGELTTLCFICFANISISHLLKVSTSSSPPSVLTSSSSHSALASS